MRAIFSELLRQDRLIIRDDLVPDSPKTKELVKKLSNSEDRKILIIIEEYNTDMYLASRNLPNVKINLSNSLSPAALVNSDKVYVTSQAIKLIEERLG